MFSSTGHNGRRLPHTGDLPESFQPAKCDFRKKNDVSLLVFLCYCCYERGRNTNIIHSCAESAAVCVSNNGRLTCR